MTPQSPTPITLLARPRRMSLLRDPAHSLATLPYDMLAYITPYLDFADVRNLSLVSKHLHSMIPVHLSRLNCTTPEGLRNLEAYLYFNIPDRAPRLLSLTLHLNAHAKSFDELSVNQDLAKGIIRILTVTQQLRELRLVFDPVSPTPRWFRGQPRFLEAIGNLPRLTTLYSSLMRQGANNTSIYPSSLRELHLAQGGHSKCSIADLSRALSHVTALETIVLEDTTLRDWDLYIIQGTSTLHTLPSVKTLQLISTELLYSSALAFPNVFPNLSTLCLVYCSYRLDIHATQTQEKISFPSLHHISIANAFRDICLPFVANRLTIVMGDKTSGYSVTTVSSPRVGLTLKTPLSQWHLSTYIDTRYRWLELESDRPNLNWIMSHLVSSLLPLSVTNDSQPMILIIAQASLLRQPRPHSPLMCLSILAPGSNLQSQNEGVDEETRDLFLRTVADCFPRLEYIALAAPRWTNMQREDDHTGERGPWRWWRVIWSAAGIPEEIQKFPAWEGERVRDYLRCADVDAMDKFAGTLSR